MSARRRRQRVRIERQIGRASGARLTIDHLTFDISEADVQQLAAQLLRVLAASAPAAAGKAVR